ncbi:MAG: tetratricopeptide repeat protein [Gammaproteobacteria bacterium]|nr:tetratricopeptide repeat protein [Gammaproteobacteria bacterium]
MSFGRWILIHSFSIFLVTAFFLGYVFRAELQLEQVYRQLLNIDPKSVSITSKTRSQATASGEAQLKPEKQDPTSTTDTPAKSVQIGIRSEQSKTQTSALPTTAQTPVSPIVNQTSAPQAIPARVPDLQDELFLARKAYWKKNYADAIAGYQLLIQKDRGNPDLRGELGNIYYALNDTDNASKLYYQSAMILLQQNRPEQARLLLSPIIAMNRELGEDLKLKIQQ